MIITSKMFIAIMFYIAAVNFLFNIFIVFFFDMDSEIVTAVYTWANGIFFVLSIIVAYVGTL